MTFDAREQQDEAPTVSGPPRTVTARLDLPSARDQHGLGAEVVREGSCQFRRSALVDVSLPPFRSLIPTQMGVPQRLLESLVPLAIPRAPACQAPFHWGWAAVAGLAVLPAALWLQWPGPPGYTTDGGLSTAFGAAASGSEIGSRHALAARVESRASERLASPRVAVVLNDKPSARGRRRSPRRPAAIGPQPANGARARHRSTRDTVESSLFVPTLTLDDELLPRPELQRLSGDGAPPQSQVIQAPLLPTR